MSYCMCSRCKGEKYSLFRSILGWMEQKDNKSPSFHGFEERPLAIGHAYNPRKGKIFKLEMQWSGSKKI